MSREPKTGRTAHTGGSGSPQCRAGQYSVEETYTGAEAEENRRTAEEGRKEPSMASKRTKEILALLDEVYTREYKCYLNYETPEQLLVATMLSAQCTDARVNIVTKELFAKYPDMEAFAGAKQEELEQDIRSTGFYRNKAKNVIACAKKLCSEYGGKVPGELEALTSLPGVGRKTANVIRGNIFHEPSVVVDTHVKRISRRLGLTGEEDPEKIEYELMRVLPREHWILYNIQIITFGRQICFAKNPRCGECFLTEYCLEYAQKVKKRRTDQAGKAEDETKGRSKQKQEKQRAEENENGERNMRKPQRGEQKK